MTQVGYPNLSFNDRRNRETAVTLRLIMTTQQFLSFSNRGNEEAKIGGQPRSLFQRFVIV